MALVCFVVFGPLLTGCRGAIEFRILVVLDMHYVLLAVRYSFVCGA